MASADRRSARDRNRDPCPRHPALSTTLAGEADADFQITLTLDDEIGNRATRALPITIRDPECTPIRDALLYTGPDYRFERASYAVQNVRVLANGVNPAKLKVISAIPPPAYPTTCRRSL